MPLENSGGRREEKNCFADKNITPGDYFLFAVREMDPDTQRKIVEAVLDILRKSNMEEMTEFKVRLEASNRLGFDLSENERKGIVRSVVENFLLFHVEDEGGKGKEADSNDREKTKGLVQEEKKQESRLDKEVSEGGERVICKVSKRHSVWFLLN